MEIQTQSPEIEQSLNNLFTELNRNIEGGFQSVGYYETPKTVEKICLFVRKKKTDGKPILGEEELQKKLADAERLRIAVLGQEIASLQRSIDAYQNNKKINELLQRTPTTIDSDSALEVFQAEVKRREADILDEKRKIKPISMPSEDLPVTTIPEVDAGNESVKGEEIIKEGMKKLTSFLQDQNPDLSPDQLGDVLTRLARENSHKDSTK